MKLVARKSVSRSINRTTTHVRSQVSVRAREKTTVKAAYAKKGTRIPYKSTAKTLSSKVVVSGRRIPLIGFSGQRQTNKGVTGRIYKSEARILRPSAFIATMPSGHTGIFWRDLRNGGKGRQGRSTIASEDLYKILTWMKKNPQQGGDRRLVVRLGITELYGPSLPDLINSDTVWLGLRISADERLKKELDQNFSYYMGELK